MTEPTTREEYERRVHANTRVDGTGFGVHVVIACAFCGAPGFMTMMPAQMALTEYAEGAGTTPSTCSECGRSAKNIVTRGADGSIAAELVQTGGPDPAEWLRPWPRRVEDVRG